MVSNEKGRLNIMKLAFLYMFLFAGAAVLTVPLAITSPLMGLAMFAAAAGFKICFWLRINQEI